MGELILVSVLAGRLMTSTIPTNLSNLYLVREAVPNARLPQDERDLLRWPFSLNVRIENRSDIGWLNQPSGSGVATSRITRSVAVLSSFAQPLPTACRELSKAANASDDASLHLAAAEACRAAGEWSGVPHFYERALPVLMGYDGWSQHHYAETVKAWLAVAHVRAGHELVESGQFAAAASHVEAGLAAFPRNVISLADKARVDAMQGNVPSGAARALGQCDFQLPMDDDLVGLVSRLGEGVAAIAAWSPETVNGLREFTEWHDSAGRQEVARLRLNAASLSTTDHSDDVLQRHSLVPGSDGRTPTHWQWRTWAGEQWDDAVYFGGVEWVSDLNEHAVRVSGICVADRQDRERPHAGFGLRAPWPSVPPGERLLFSFLYRTDPVRPGSPGVYVSWGEGTADRYRSSFNLSPTHGRWQRYELELVNPVGAAVPIYLNLRSFGLGTVWFAGIKLEPEP